MGNNYLISKYCLCKICTDTPRQIYFQQVNYYNNSTDLKESDKLPTQKNFTKNRKVIYKKYFLQYELEYNKAYRR